MNEVPTAIGVEDVDVLDQTNLNIIPSWHGFQFAITTRVSAHHVGRYRPCLFEGTSPWWEFPENITHGGEDCGLVDGTPPLHAIAQNFEHFLTEYNPIFDVCFNFESSFILKPNRMRKVMQGAHRLDVSSQ